jgi:pyruvate/2-oxoglutarate dehydrogenase complex dihydrolipoamide acyltransferase (E2) component
VGRNHLHFLNELDATGMDRWRRAAGAAGQTRPSYTAFVIKAAAIALREHPHLNRMIRERPFSTRLVPLDNVTATVAVEGVVGHVDMVFAPMLREPDERALADLTDQLRLFATTEPAEVPEFRRFVALAKWARWVPSLVGALLRLPSRSRRLWTAFRGGAFAVTSPAKYGGCDAVLPPWPWPLTFSFGHVRVRPWVADGRVVARKTMRLTLTSDRRLANGAPLARFAERVRQLLERPEQMEPLPVAPGPAQAKGTASARGRVSIAV